MRIRVRRLAGVRGFFFAQTKNIQPSHYWGIPMKRLMKRALWMGVAGSGVLAGSLAFALPTGAGDPIANITPNPLNFTVNIGESATQSLSIGNAGVDPLTWSITEATALQPNAGMALPRVVPAALAGARGGNQEANHMPRANPAPLAMVLNEGFDDITTLVAAGWLVGNHSNPLGTTDWFQGNDQVFTAYDGSATSYIGANFNNTSGAGTISNWLVSPQITFNPGSTASFYTRTATGAAFADRLEVRLCTTGACTNFGSGDSDAGDFTTVLLTINPNLATGADATGVNGYPDVWTKFDLSGLPSSGSGRIAFRYYVTDAGPDGSNSNFIGLDRVVVDNGTAVPGGCTNPSDVSWLSESETSGSVNGGASQSIDVTVNAGALTAGAHSAHLCVATNDPSAPLVDVVVNVTAVLTHTVSTAVTPAAGGTIAPASATVVHGATTTFNVTPATGYHVYEVTGCGGTFDSGSGVYTTGAINADCTVTASMVPDGASNGIIHSAALNHAVMENTGGTSLNIMTSAFDDAGPISGDWDFNFWASSGTLRFWTVGTHSAKIAVDGSGKAIAFHNGDVIGPALTFSGSGTSVQAGSEWLGGTTAALGVQFACNARGLPWPVVGGTCYGFIQMSTLGPKGFPATIIDTTFDGDGNAITVSGVIVLNDPSATITPNGVFMSAPANGMATVPLNIANAAGSEPLTYSILSREAALQPHVGTQAANVGKAKLHERLMNRADLQPKLDWMAAQAAIRPTLGMSRRSGGHSDRNLPWMPTGSIAFMLDDGSYENSVGWGDTNSDTENSALWLNRFNATGALTIDSVSILWPTLNTGTLVGKQVNIVAYYDANADGDPSDAVRLGSDNLQVVASLDAYLTYATSFSVPAAGDVYIGFFNTYANGTTTPELFPAAVDTNTVAGQSWLAANGSGDGSLAIGGNDTIGTIDSLSAGSITGTWLIRATGDAAGGGGGPCTGPVVPWLSATPPSATVMGGENININVTANPSAASLAPGNYSAELCITTNDPTQTLIAVPISLTVTAATPAACASGPDVVFCNGFDPMTVNPDIVTGVINQAVVADENGSGFDFSSGSLHPFSSSAVGDDINLYTLATPAISVYWYADIVPVAFGNWVGGVVTTPGQADFRMLHSGDVIGPASPISGASQGADMTAFQAGGDGYIGVAFYNETTRRLNFGYLHVQTSAGGFPIQVLDYGYDKTGNPITIP